MPTGKMIETKIFLRNVSPLKMVSMVSKNNVSNPLIYIKKCLKLHENRSFYN